MPWINAEQCSGCSICTDNCPADAIQMNSKIAVIDDAACIRCGICHGICPVHAVRHDSELIPGEVKANAEWIATLQAHPHYAGNPERQKQLRERLKKHFNKTIQVARQTMDQILATSQ